jgi:hypothetical protein
MNLQEVSMKKFAISVALVLTPAALLAQVQTRAQSQARADADVKAGSHTSASASTSVDAEIAVARDRGLPERPMRRRAAEGRAKGASDAQIALAVRALRANLETAHETMVSAGRARPSDEETECGAYALERGYTSAQLEAVVRSAPSDRSLVVAFDVLARLQTRGVASARAVARVTSMLAERASDTEINALVNANAGAALGAGKGVGVGAAGNAAAGASAGVGKGAASATGTVTGTVKGVIKP